MTRQAVPDVNVSALDHLSAGQVAEVRRLIDAVGQADGVQPFSDHVRLHLAGAGADGSRRLLAFDGDALIGFAHVDAPDEGVRGAELAVHPDHRGRGAGAALLRAVVDSAPGERVRVWAHGAGGEPNGDVADGAGSAAARLARRFGFRQARSLWQMRADLTATLPPVDLPDGVTLRAFVPDQDEPAWTRLNNLAFASHPEQGSWTEAEIRLRESEDWFDPTGFLLAERPAGAAARLVGFHWTKVHRQDIGGPDGHRHEPIGEVYVIGVDPAEAGRGLGRALTLAGLTHLADRGLSNVLLYVDEDNTRAIKLYERLGFHRWSTDISYQSESASAEPAKNGSDQFGSTDDTVSTSKM